MGLLPSIFTDLAAEVAGHPNGQPSSRQSPKKHAVCLPVTSPMCTAFRSLQGFVSSLALGCEVPSCGCEECGPKEA